MSESEQLILPFDELDIGSVTESDAPTTAIMALASDLDTVDPTRFGTDIWHYEAEVEQTARRHEWLVQADQAFQNTNYSECSRMLRYILEDIDHSGIPHESAVIAINEIVGDCIRLAREKGRAAVAQVIRIPEAQPPGPTSIDHPLAG